MRRPTSEAPVLPGYDYVSLLGSGGFSDVFLYEQKLPKRRVAVKVLLVDEELTAANRAAFVAEANLMAQLSAHPYIVTIYHADVAAGDRPYFVMEYCSGPSLADRYKSSPLSVVDALSTGVRLSAAVATAHAAGILHRDIKPGNVLSNEYGRPALTDFGISSALDDEVLPVHTSTFSRSAAAAAGSTQGTGQSIGLSVPWSPPEMFEDDPDPDVRADVFSLAATIWTVLAGQTPFEVRGRSNGTLDLIGRIERGAITPMARDDVPRSLIAVLQKGMATRREDRFASAIEFGRALQRVEIELGYSRTELEVPNMHLEAPPQRDAEQSEDETRVRSVSTIDAQPISPPAAPVHDPDETRVRATPTIVAQPVTPGTASTAAQRTWPAADPTSGPAGVLEDAPLETIVRPRGSTASGTPDDAPPRRSPVAAIVVGVIALVVVVAVVIAIALFGSTAGGDDPDPSASGTGGPAVLPTGPAAPELLGAPLLNADGTVTFLVSNPDPEDGDTLSWRISNLSDDEPRHPIDDGTTIVAPYTAGTPLCIEVNVNRGGKLSDDLDSCYPAAP